MTLERSDIEKIAHLARLAINDDDVPHYARDLSNILELVEQMNRVATDTIEPLAHPVDATQRFRPDVVTETDQRDRFQRIAPAVEAHLYLVPKVIE